MCTYAQALAPSHSYSHLRAQRILLCEAMIKISIKMMELSYKKIEETCHCLKRFLFTLFCLW